MVIKRLPAVRSLLFFLGLLVLTACSNRMVIINDVEERSANEIVVFLASKGIAVNKVAAASSQSAGAGGPVIPMWNIEVDAVQATEAMAILNRNGLPRPPGQTLLDLFADPGLVPTDLQEQIRFQAGLSEQIAGTIRKIDGVIDADVQVSFPPVDSPLPITASVYVKHQGVLDNPNSHLITKIQQLVAGSVSGLKLENVTVISDRSRFADVSFSSNPNEIEREDTEYASVWGVVVAQESVGSFQFLFFTLFLILFLLIAAMVWLIWKFMPLFSQLEGGWRSLLKLRAVAMAAPAAPLPEEEADEEGL